MLSSTIRGSGQRGLALLMIGVMLSLFAANGFAQDTPEDIPAVIPEEPSAPSHFAWSAAAEIDANYIWRGLYVGGLSLQAEADVEYYGFFVNMWWNVGATDWSFGKRNEAGQPITGFNPEVDMTIGYRYKGLTVMFMHMYYFDRYADGQRSRYFDFSNYAPGGGGITSEWRVKYRISDKVPLHILWCTRTFGRDGYMQGGELKRAYSTYIEVGYNHTFKHDISLGGAIGLTPWKSMYTGFEKDFAIVNVNVALSKSWTLTDYCSVNLGGVVMLNPSSLQPMANIRAGVAWH